MFVTYPNFQAALSPDADATVWWSVEIIRRFSWFLVTLRDSASAPVRTLIVSRDRDLADLAANANEGRLTGVSLVVPPSLSSSGEWEIVRIKRVARTVPGDAELSVLVLTSEDGISFNGSGATRLTPAFGHVDLLAQFD